MAKIVLISCVSKKLDYQTKAKNLYISDLFKKRLKYAQLLNPDKIFILSAKHNLVDLNKKIKPYDMTLNKMNVEQRRKWSDLVLKQLSQKADLKKDKFVLLAGNKYREFLPLYLKYCKIPMKGLKLGQQLQWLKNKIENEQKLQ